MSREDKIGYIGMSATERRLIELIRESDDPGCALTVAVDVITSYLMQHESFGAQATTNRQGFGGTN